MPLAQVPPDAWSWLSRSMTVIATGTATAPLVDAVRAGVYEVDPSVPVYDVTTLQDALRGMLAPARFSTLLLSLLGALGLVLAATGVHEIVLAGPTELLDGPLREAADRTIRARVMPVSSEALEVRTSTLGEDVVIIHRGKLVKQATIAEMLADRALELRDAVEDPHAVGPPAT